MKNVILKLFMAVVISIMGAALLEEILTDPIAGIGEKIMLSAFGILLVFTGVAVGAVGIHNAYIQKKRLEGKRVSDIIKEEIATTLTGLHLCGRHRSNAEAVDVFSGAL